MDILQPSIEQSPLFGNTSPNSSSLFVKWEYGFYKFLQWVGDTLPIVFSQDTWNIIKAVLAVVSIFCITVIVYCTVRMFEIRKKEHHHLHEEIEEYAHHMAEKEKEKQRLAQISTNPEWVNVVNYLSSSDESKWKSAVLEADVMLEKLLNQLGFKGETLGEKLKAVDSKKFRNLPAAWEAHAVRNRIAHEGGSFVLTLREAKRVISLYEQIFQEFGYI